MCDKKFKLILILLLFIEVHFGNGMPQGFFSQGFSIPRFVPNIPSIKIESPIKSSLFNVFGKQKSDNNIKNSEKVHEPVNFNQIGRTEDLKVDQNLLSNGDNEARITNQGKEVSESNKNVQVTKITDVPKKDIQVEKKIDAILEKDSIINVLDTYTTTEFTAETTTDDYETTTLDDVFNRSSPQLVASLLG